MSRINSYEPIEKKFRNFLSPVSKSFKGVSFGYQEKVWTLQEQIHYKLNKIAHFVELLFLNVPEVTATSKMLKKNSHVLLADLQSLQNSLKDSPFEFDKQKLGDNEYWINDMKAIGNRLKLSVKDRNDLKIVGKMLHTLNELDHLINPELKGFDAIRPDAADVVHLSPENQSKPVSGKKKTPLKVSQLKKSALKTKQPEINKIKSKFKSTKSVQAKPKKIKTSSSKVKKAAQTPITKTKSAKHSQTASKERETAPKSEKKIAVAKKKPAAAKKSAAKIKKL